MMNNLSYWKYPAIIITLIIVTFTAYQASLTHNLLINWDDQGYVTNNPHIKELNWQSIHWMFTHFHMHNWHPLTLISYAVDYQLFGLEGGGYHLTNLIFHILNVIWFFFTGVVILHLSRLTPSQSTSPHALFPLMAAGLAASLLAIHPQHVESVVWVSERKDVLFLFFFFPAILSYIRYVHGRRWQWYVLSIIFFILAALSKPMSVSFPIILILLDIYPLRRTSFTAQQLYPASYYKLLWEKVPFIFISAGLVVLTFLAQKIGSHTGEEIIHSMQFADLQLSGGALMSLESLNFTQRLLHVAESYIHYLSKLFFPFSFSPYYQMDWQFAIYPLFTLLAITVLTIYAWYKKQYYWLIIWLFYLITLLPVIGLVKIGGQAAADRYAYLPLLPIYLLLGAAVTHILFTVYHRQQVFFVAFILTAVLVIGVTLHTFTRQQVLIWRDDETLWQHALSLDPFNYRAMTNLGQLKERQGDIGQAIRYYRAAISSVISPTDPGQLHPYNALAELYLRHQYFAEGLAMYEMMEKKGLNADSGEDIDNIYANMAIIYAKFDQTQKAIHAAQKALAINPQHQEALKVLADLKGASAVQDSR